jgi:L-amino acid N-acyltransferase YncA
MGSGAGKVVLRDADPDRDAAACAAIYEPYVRDTCISFEERPPTAEEFRTRIRTTMATHPWLVAEDGGVVIGYAYASTHRPRAAYRWAADVTVYLAPTHHRAGVGRALYTELFERLRRRNFRVLCAGVTLPNDASVGLHRAMGFETVGIYKRIGWKLGAWRDVVWLQLEIGSQTDEVPAEPILGPAQA